jgi:hypothetical protein
MTLTDRQTLWRSRFWAFRRFKDAVERLGIADEWSRFRKAALEKIAIEVLEARGSPTSGSNSKNEKKPL